MFSAVLFLPSLALSRPGIPAPCNYPDQFSAEMTTFFYAQNTLERGMVYYDGVNERVFEDQKTRNGHQFTDFANLLLFKQDAHYAINVSSGNCFYGKIDPAMRTWHAFGIHKDATFHAQVTAGLYPTTFLVNEFGYNTQNRNATYSSWHHVTAAECMPTSTNEFVRTSTGEMDLDKSATRTYFNAVLGVEDPAVFIPPTGCKPFPPPSPPASVCSPTLKRLCGMETKGTRCSSCVATHAAALKAAGCTVAIEEEFCKVPPHSVCTPALVKACGSLEHKGATCDKCCSDNAAALKAAGCTSAIEVSFCHAPAPPPPHSVCTPALVKACGSLEHKGANCTKCCQTNEVALAKAGCTTKIESEFCNSAPPAPPHSVCTPALTRLCGTLEHQGTVCTKCLALHPTELKAAGCTTAIEDEFCKATAQL